MWLNRFVRGLFKGREAVPKQSNDATALRDVGDAIIATVECARCGERIDVRMRKSSDIPSASAGDPFDYFVQKTVVGTKCFNRIELRLEMDRRYRLLRSEAKGGRLVVPGAEASTESPT